MTLRIFCVLGAGKSGKNKIINELIDTIRLSNPTASIANRGLPVSVDEIKFEITAFATVDYIIFKGDDFLDNLNEIFETFKSQMTFFLTKRSFLETEYPRISNDDVIKIKANQIIIDDFVVLQNQTWEIQNFPIFTENFEIFTNNPPQFELRYIVKLGL